MDLSQIIEKAWSNPQIALPEAGDAVETILDQLDSGQLRIAEKTQNGWIVHQWLKKAILLSFKWNKSRLIPMGESVFYDKVRSKFQGWSEADFLAQSIRAVPGALVRHSAYIGANVVLMPCFVNVGAFVDQGCMIDTWSTVGSCAQIGRNVHISGGVGIGGVLEPLQANPVIIEDECFIGARSEITEGVIVEHGSVLSMGVFLTASTKIVHRQSGEILYGRIPPFSVVIPGTLPSPPLADGSPAPSLSCAVIVKHVDERTRARTSVNDILRTL